MRLWEPFTDFVQMNVGDDAYHASSALGSTMLKRLLYPMEPRSDIALREGTAFHWLLFERDRARRLLVKERKFGRSNDEKKAKARWHEHCRKEGLFPLPAESYDAVHKMAEGVLAIKMVRDLIESEHAVIETPYRFGHQRWTALELKRKADLDVPGHACVDAKSTTEPNEEAYLKHAMKLGYDLQAAFYRDSGEALWMEHYRRGFWHVVACKKPDCNGEHQVGLIRIHEGWLERGRLLYQAAMLQADTQRITGRPPAYPFNSGPRICREPTKWETREAKALLAFATREWNECTNPAALH